LRHSQRNTLFYYARLTLTLSARPGLLPAFRPYFGFLHYGTVLLLKPQNVSLVHFFKAGNWYNSLSIYGKIRDMSRLSEYRFTFARAKWTQTSIF
jgi:hypothetical protein